MRTAVITVVRGRRAHLLRQHAGLSESVELPGDYVVVAMGEPSLSDWQTASHPHPQVVALPCSAELLPLAAARNIGALEAIAAGAELLIFLDVDCIPSPFMLTWYCAAAKIYPDALLSGAVGYLPPDADFTGDLDPIAHFHAFRPRLPIGSVDAADPRLFWSLSFAVTTATWRRIGGFHEAYRGYGGEDTDFALQAQRAGVDMVWVGGAEAFHQHHDTSDPPVEHLDDILKNGELFASRWGFWPMQGWLEAFASLGLVEHNVATDQWARVGMAR